MRNRLKPGLRTEKAAINRRTPKPHTTADAMKSLLANISLRKFVGLYLGEHEVSASEVAVTPLGPVEIATRTEPCPPNELLGVVERVLQSLQGPKRRRLQVAIGLPNSRVFFGTRPLRSGADATPAAVMQKLLCSSNITVEDLTIDLIKSTVNKAPLASVAACRKKYMAAVLGVLQRCGARSYRAEPAPYALVRAAARQYHPPRRAATLLRVFLARRKGWRCCWSAGCRWPGGRLPCRRFRRAWRCCRHRELF